MQKIYKFGRLTPTKMKTPPHIQKQGIGLLITHHALPFWLKVEAIKKMIGGSFAKFKGKIKNFE